ncbi:MAG: hypothetical protein MHMPM18_004585 [Marteilia pararefringens]
MRGFVRGANSDPFTSEAFLETNFLLEIDLSIKSYKAEKKFSFTKKTQIKGKNSHNETLGKNGEFLKKIDIQ